MAVPNIPGSLPFVNSPSVDFSGNPANLTSSYAQAYGNALTFNATNYQNVLSGFDATRQAQANALGEVGTGYGNLSKDVLGTISGIGASQQQAINDYYAQQKGNATQDLANRGLGNTTVVDATQRGLSLDQQKANIALANSIAGLTAGYQSQIGQAGLSQQNQAALANTNLAQNQLGFQERVSAPYPNSQLYANLAQQYGSAQQANADRAAIMASRDAMLKAGNRSYGNPAPGLNVHGGGEVSPFGPTPGSFTGGGIYQPAGGSGIGGAGGPATNRGLAAPGSDFNQGNNPYGYDAAFGPSGGPTQYGDAGYGIGPGNTPFVSPSGATNEDISGDATYGLSPDAAYSATYGPSVYNRGADFGNVDYGGPLDLAGYFDF